MITGGGTGGHIFPAVAVATELRDRFGADVLFIGALGRMEMEKVPAAGFPIEGLPISGLQRSLKPENLLFPFKLISSVVKAGKILKRFRPDAVAGFGGYASGPTLRAAIRMKIPVAIQEQNAFPGLVNRWIGPKANKIFVAHNGLEKWFPADKILVTGNPVRATAIAVEGKKEEALATFGFEAGIPTLLIVGGSQGALSVNRAVTKHLGLFADNGYQVLWQTGKYFYDEACKALEAFPGKKIKAVTFIDRMDLAYALADVVVSRAGAIAISEICAVGVPPVLVPLPTAAEDHQTKNAQALAEADAAFLLPDNKAGEDLGQVVSQLMSDREMRDRFSKNLKRLAKPDAAKNIAEEIIKLAGENK
ncbi:MAG: undecaprenyldiphospho-muramoylpentapeptide beta-N-acetylglucosaminyltransferase [Bacteroidales bacterium]